MPLDADQKKLLFIVQRYPSALKLLATRVRALEMMLQERGQEQYAHYLLKLGEIESRIHPASAALESSELDSLLDLLNNQKLT